MITVKDFNISVSELGKSSTENIPKALKKCNSQ